MKAYNKKRKKYVGAKYIIEFGVPVFIRGLCTKRECLNYHRSKDTYLSERYNKVKIRYLAQERYDNYGIKIGDTNPLTGALYQGGK